MIENVQHVKIGERCVVIVNDDVTAISYSILPVQLRDPIMPCDWALRFVYRNGDTCFPATFFLEEDAKKAFEVCLEFWREIPDESDTSLREVYSVGYAGV